MRPNTDRGLAPSSRPAVILLAFLVLVAAWLRLGGLPGPWGTDALSYMETLLRGTPTGSDPRSQRVVFLTLVRLGTRLTTSPVIGASLPGVLLSVAVIPALWAAGRRSLGSYGALAPAALWCVLGLDLEEVVEVSADAALALPVTLALLLVLSPGRAGQRPLHRLTGAGVLLGLAIVLKETAVFATLGVAAAAWAAAPQTNRPVRAGAFRTAAVAVPAACVAIVLTLVLTQNRLGVVSGNLAESAALVRAGDPGFLRRMSIGVPELLLTATGAFGLLLVGALPLLARLPFRAFRRDAPAVAFLVGLAALAWCPVSLAPFAVLPARFPRYALALIPALLLALAAAWRTMPAEDRCGRIERAAGIAGLAVALLFVSPDAAGTWVILPGALLAAYPLWPADWRRRCDTQFMGCATLAMGLLLSVMAWSYEAPPDTPATGWLGFAVVFVILLARWTGARVDLRGLFIAGLGLSYAAGTAALRFAPDRSFDAWSELPGAGAVFAERVLVRRLAISAHDDPTRDASRLRVWDGGEPPALGPQDRLLVRLRSPALDRAQASDSLASLPPRLDEAVMFGPAAR